MIFGAVLGLVSVYPSSDVPVAIRVLTLIAALLVVAHGADLLPKGTPRAKEEAVRQVLSGFQLLLGIAMGFVCVLPTPDATMTLRVPALFTALVLVATATNPEAWLGPRRRPVRTASFEEAFEGMGERIGDDGLPVDATLLPMVEAEEEPPPPEPTSYPQTSPVVQDRTRLAVPAVLVALAAWLGLALLAQPEPSGLAWLSFLAMFGLFTAGWRRLAPGL
jgi:hypothetical protein